MAAAREPSVAVTIRIPTTSSLTPPFYQKSW